MNFEFFVAKRVFWGKDSANNISRPIVNIAVAGIAIGIAVMLLSVGIVTGFQGEITKKVTGFESHIKVVSLMEESNEYNKLIIDYALLESLKKVEGVEHVQLFAQQPGIIEFNNEIQGTLIKGLAKDYQRDFFEQHLVAGKLPDFDEKGALMLSSTLANKLNFKLGDKVKLYFVNKEQNIKPRVFTVKALFKTGLAAFDQQKIFIGLGELQKIKNYGIQAYIGLDSTATSYLLIAKAFGGDRKYRFRWSNNTTVESNQLIAKMNAPKQVQVIVSDGDKTLPDTARIMLPSGTLTTSGGSDKWYTEGNEIFIKDLDQLDHIAKEVYDISGYNLTTKTVKEESPEIFNWLAILDINVYIIIILMIVVAVVNMCSALLILILEKANMIGLLKAIGANNISLRKIFIYNSVLLISKGLLWGNCIGIGLALLQKYTGLITLPEEQYYLHEVPIYLSLSNIVLLNLGTLVISILVLILPSLLIARLSPAKTIRFE